MNALIEKLKIYGIKTFFSYLVLETFYRLWTNVFLGSYSQQGEDLFMDKLLKKKKGFYVDVGANDPDRFNNTKMFYKKGWNGINIEPDSGLFAKLSKKRKRDINLNIGIGEEKSDIVYYKFIPHTLSTFSKEEADNYVAQGFRLVGTKKVFVKRLEDVLAETVGARDIDFISIDTEGYDIHVLKSNDWQRFRPRLICIESVTHTMDGKNNTKADEHEEYLRSVGYKKIFDNGLNSIYKDER